MGIKSFLSYAKNRLVKFNGIPRQHFHLFLKECEWRFNIGTPMDVYQESIKLNQNKKKAS